MAIMEMLLKVSTPLANPHQKHIIASTVAVAVPIAITSATGAIHYNRINTFGCTSQSSATLPSSPIRLVRIFGITHHLHLLRKQ